MNTARTILIPAAVMGLLAAGSFAAAPPSAPKDPSPLTAKFKGIRESRMGLYGMYTITNTGKRDIDDIVMYLTLKNKDGESLSLTAVTDATPGLAWLKAGKSIEEGVPLDQRKAAKTLLETQPEAGRLVIEIQSITYMKQ